MIILLNPLEIPEMTEAQEIPEMTEAQDIPEMTEKNLQL